MHHTGSNEEPSTILLCGTRVLVDEVKYYLRQQMRLSVNWRVEHLIDPLTRAVLTLSPLRSHFVIYFAAQKSKYA